MLRMLFCPSDFLDAAYKHNDKPGEMFRAVRIVRPVKELSGNFSCEVQDDAVEADDEVDAKANEEQIASHQLFIYGELESMRLSDEEDSRQRRE